MPVRCVPRRIGATFCTPPSRPIRRRGGRSRGWARTSGHVPRRCATSDHKTRPPSRKESRKWARRRRKVVEMLRERRDRPRRFVHVTDREGDGWASLVTAWSDGTALITRVAQHHRAAVHGAVGRGNRVASPSTSPRPRTKTGPLESPPPRTKRQGNKALHEMCPTLCHRWRGAARKRGVRSARRDSRKSNADFGMRCGNGSAASTRTAPSTPKSSNGTGRSFRDLAKWRSQTHGPAEGPAPVSGALPSPPLACVTRSRGARAARRVDRYPTGAAPERAPAPTRPRPP